MRTKLCIVMVILALVFSVTSCTENKSNGERIGLITRFASSGFMWKSWEGELHVTQTGMNSTMNDFQFSIDNDHPLPDSTINLLDSAAQHGWKVKLTYHQTQGWNWFCNRGETNYFITKVEVLDKVMQNLFINQDNKKDTMYMIIVNPSELKRLSNL